MTDQTALEAVRALGERTEAPCTNPDCQSGFADLKVHYCDTDESCCDGCRIASDAGQALLELKAKHFDAAVEALEKRQCHMCCYPPEPCDRCRADADLLAAIRKAATEAM